MSSTRSRWKRRRVRALFVAQEGRCFWCDCEMTLERRSRDRLFNHSATLDHVFTRGDPRRYERALDDQIVRTVAACYACNNDRGNTPFEEYLKVCRKARAAEVESETTG